MDSTILQSGGNPDLSEDLLIKRVDENEAIMASLEDTLNDLISLENEVVSGHMVCKAQAVAFESITGQSLAPYAPVAGFTEQPSTTNRDALIDALKNGRASIASKDLVVFLHALQTIIAACNPYSLPQSSDAPQTPTDSRAAILRDLKSFVDGLGEDSDAYKAYHEMTWALLREWILSARNRFIKDFFSGSVENKTREAVEMVKADLVRASFSMVSRLEVLKKRLLAVSDGKATIDGGFVSLFERPIESQAAVFLDSNRPAADVLYDFLSSICNGTSMDESVEADDVLGAWINNVVAYAETDDTSSQAPGNPVFKAVLSVPAANRSLIEAAGFGLGDELGSSGDYVLETSLNLPSDAEEQQKLIDALKVFYNTTVRIWANLYDIYRMSTKEVDSFVDETIRRLLAVLYFDRFANIVKEAGPEHAETYSQLVRRFYNVR